jgi:geranylgeranyl pyrophosphate synthase
VLDVNSYGSFEGSLMAQNNVQVVSEEISFQAFLEEAKKVVDCELQNLQSVISQLRLHDKIDYVLNTEGKRLRAALVLLSGQSVGGNREHLRKMALAVEIVHTATLVHDDILDQDLFRRNALSVQAKYGVKDAILVGDALAALSVGLVRDYKKEILDVLSNACLLLSDGEYMDIEMSEAAFSEKDYFEKVKKKTGALFRTAAQCGALAAEASPVEVASLAGFGENYGVAFQIKDDVTDISALENEEESNIPTDLKEFRATLPIIHLYETGGTEIQELLKKLMAPKTKTYEKRMLLSELLVNIGSSGSLLYCQNQADHFINAALASLSELRSSRFKTGLIQMAEALKLK